jgi:hypothetical protein
MPGLAAGALEAPDGKRVQGGLDLSDALLGRVNELERRRLAPT